MRTEISSFDSRAIQSKKTWVDEGFSTVSTWKHGAQRIKAHSTSSLHTACSEALSNVAKINVAQQISTATLKQMMDNRTALMKIFNTLTVLAKQGLSIRGDIRTATIPILCRF